MPKHESNTGVFLVMSTITWPNEPPTKRIVNWNNPKAVRSFARISTTCLAKGGEVNTKRISVEEAEAYDEIAGAECAVCDSKGHEKSNCSFHD